MPLGSWAQWALVVVVIIGEIVAYTVEHRLEHKKKAEPEKPLQKLVRCPFHSCGVTMMEPMELIGGRWFIRERTPEKTEEYMQELSDAHIRGEHER